MPLLVLARLIAGLLSWAILGGSVYLLWSWWESEPVAPAPNIDPEREDWRLWLGLGLLAFSFLGRFALLPLLAKPDGKRPFALDRKGPAQTAPGAAGPLAIYADGPPSDDGVVLTHGWGLSAAVWTRTRRALSGQRQVISWDLPGLGRSQGRVDSTRLDVFADDLARVIERAAPRRLVLVGHSIGGMTIQTLARRRPDLMRDRVAGVVLLNTTYTNPLRTMWLSGLTKALRWPLLEPLLWATSYSGPIAQALAWQSYLSGAAHLANRIGFAAEVTRSELEATTLLATKNRQDILARGNLAMFRWDAGEGLRQLEGPVLVLGGGVDLVTKCEASRTIAAQLGGADLQVVERANHMGFLEQDEAYNRAIADFVDRAFQTPTPAPSLEVGGAATARPG